MDESTNDPHDPSFASTSTNSPRLTFRKLMYAFGATGPYKMRPVGATDRDQGVYDRSPAARGQRLTYDYEALPALTTLAYLRILLTIQTCLDTTNTEEFDAADLAFNCAEFFARNVGNSTTSVRFSPAFDAQSFDNGNRNSIPTAENSYLYGIGNALKPLCETFFADSFTRTDRDHFTVEAFELTRNVLADHPKGSVFIGSALSNAATNPAPTSTFPTELELGQNLADFLEFERCWSFWSEWFRNFLNGPSLEPTLLRKVAQIDDNIWGSGPDAIAAEIERIRARQQVEVTLGDLKDSLKLQSTARHGIGGNNPPESIQDERLSGPIIFIWDATEELSTALEEENPRREWIEAILRSLKTGFLALAKWIGRKADLAVDTAIVTAIKQGGPLVGGYYALDKLIKAIEDWLPFLP